ncbi:MAG: F0F1 ATP synthase subunit B [Bacteroidota bacterium]
MFVLLKTANLPVALLTLLQHGEQKGGLLDVNPGLIIWTVITFILLLLVLKKVAWKPILTALDERENYIKDSLTKSEKAREEAEKLLSENQANLQKAEENARKIIEQGRDFAENLKEQIINDSKSEARKIVEEASAEIRRKNDEALENMKNQIAGIAVQAAEKILRENLDKDKQIDIANKYIDEIQKK